MNESEVLALIARGEDSTLDYKLQLNLAAARDKAELVKDVVAIANSSSSGGHLLIGIDDDQRPVGIEVLEEERIQQICHTYITPPVVLECDLVPIARAGSAQIGVISIKPTNRPHKVSRDIDKLRQDDVFVRRGTTTTRASPEEMIQMHEESAGVLAGVHQFIRSAEIHKRLGNFESAIRAYSKALETTPSPELFIARAEVLDEASRAMRTDRSTWHYVESALRDLNYAIQLSESEEITLRARRLRRTIGKNFAYQNYTSEQRLEDFEYEKERLSGEERGKWIFQQVVDWDVRFGADDYTVSLIREAIESGYQNDRLYLLLAQAHYGASNYGLALKEIDRLLGHTEVSSEDLAEFLCFKAEILVELKRYSDARDSLLRARATDEAAFKRLLSLHLPGHGENIVCRYGLIAEFGSSIPYPMDLVVRLLISEMGRHIVSLATSVDGKEVLQCETALDSLERRLPGALDSLRSTVDPEYWEQLRRGTTAIRFNADFPGLPELIRHIQREAFSWVIDDRREYMPFISRSDQ